MDLSDSRVGWGNHAANLVRNFRAMKRKRDCWIGTDNNGGCCLWEATHWKPITLYGTVGWRRRRESIIRTMSPSVPSSLRDACLKRAELVETLVWSLPFRFGLGVEEAIELEEKRHMRTASGMRYMIAWQKMMHIMHQLRYKMRLNVSGAVGRALADDQDRTGPNESVLLADAERFLSVLVSVLSTFEKYAHHYFAPIRHGDPNASLVPSWIATMRDGYVPSWIVPYGSLRQRLWGVVNAVAGTLYH